MRHDHSSWLIHFVRDRVPEQDFPSEAEKEIGYNAGGELENDAKAFEVLKTIIRLGGLIPGYSFRGGRTTFYGGSPTLCATEMPLYSFATYAREASMSENVSAYGIAFLKSEFYAAGGRPAIYGLSTSDVFYKINTRVRRILDDSILPVSEQYRYVAYSPSGKKWIDWSHEREWRWKVRDQKKDCVWCIDGTGSDGPTPGLRLFDGPEDDGHFSKLCVIVWNRNEALEIQQLLTGLYLGQSNNYGTPFSRKLLEASSIIVLEDVVAAVEGGKQLEAQTIEGLRASQFVKPVINVTASSETEKQVQDAFSKARKAGLEAANAYIASHDLDVGMCGFAHAITYDVTSAAVQYMLANGLADGPYDGRVHAKLDGAWPFNQNIDYQEAVYGSVSKVLTEELGFHFYMLSCLD
jgi:hypothetical protein